MPPTVFQSISRARSFAPPVTSPPAAPFAYPVNNSIHSPRISLGYPFHPLAGQRRVDFLLPATTAHHAREVPGWSGASVPPVPPPPFLFPPTLQPPGRDLEVAPPRKGVRLQKILAFFLVFPFPQPRSQPTRAPAFHSHPSRTPFAKRLQKQPNLPTAALQKQGATGCRTSQAREWGREIMENVGELVCFGWFKVARAGRPIPDKKEYIKIGTIVLFPLMASPCNGKRGYIMRGVK